MIMKLMQLTVWLQMKYTEYLLIGNRTNLMQKYEYITANKCLFFLTIIP